MKRWANYLAENADPFYDRAPPYRIPSDAALRYDAIKGGG